MPQPSGASELYIGLMSGTSIDGVDGVILDCSKSKPRVLSHACQVFPSDLKNEFQNLQSAGSNELHRASLAANALSRLYAKVADELIKSASCTPQDIRAIGAHGQTVRHRPQEFDGTGYTLQLNNPALLAELTGILVVADFRTRDIAAGGQGAPLVPAFHQTIFTDAYDTAVLNIGGIANLTVLNGHTVLGFDCGPGNTLLDLWCLKHTGQDYDKDGGWASSGQVNPGLLNAMLSEAYFAKPVPKSTGRDLFNLGWLEHFIASYPTISAADMQATLTELTAKVCANDVLRHAGKTRRLIVCGGGAFNAYLLQRLCFLLPDIHVASSDIFGIPPLQVEAAAFAWLAQKTLRGESGSLKSVTGARGARILGAIYPA
jgi:anhydro-N-acetylmuramic acid kinase